MSDISIEADIIIIGGGIAGCWLLRSLLDLGYNVLLLEQGQLGGIQTMRSQGIIHGGLKYALSGRLNSASESIARMPEYWQSCLDSERSPYLSGAKCLSPHQYMWSSQGWGNKLFSMFAVKTLKGRIDKVCKEEIPSVFDTQAFNGSLYKLYEPVLDVPSVVHTLIDGLERKVRRVDWKKDRVHHRSTGHIDYIECHDSDQVYNISAQYYVLAAGEGNQDFLDALKITKIIMQTRPLHMVMVKHSYPHAIYAHCIDKDTQPRVTITSHVASNKEQVWYIGGRIAEVGVNKSAEEQIQTAKAELDTLMPWVDLSQGQWASLKVNRAEACQRGFLKPDSFYCKVVENCVVTWPTKLAMTPLLSDQVINEIVHAGIHPTRTQNVQFPMSAPKTEIAPIFWKNYFD